MKGEVSLNLYDLTGKYKKLYEMDVDDEVFNDTIESLDDALEDKLTGYAFVIRNLEADVEAIKNEEKRLKDKRAKALKKIEDIYGRVENSMIELKLDKAPAGTMEFKFRNSKKVVIDDENSIPSQFAKYAVTYKKTDIKAAIDSGVEVPGAYIADNKTLSLK